jgi:GntR family transcriptional regulator, transcriptional repressor for pyruvate dehydrogenase complex
MIEAGEVLPGEKLPSQRILAARFTISRASLREALSVLETLGFIRVEAGRGAIVCQDRGAPSRYWRLAERFPPQDVFQMRLLIESYTARLAANLLSRAQLSELRANVALMQKALEANDLEAGAQTDLLFHRLIVEAAANKVYAEIYRLMSGVIIDSHRLPLTARGRLHEPVVEHEAIVGALEARDPEGAVQHMRYHLVRTAGRSGIDEALCRAW